MREERDDPTGTTIDLALVIPNLGVGGLERGTLSLSCAAKAMGLRTLVITLTDPRTAERLTLMSEFRAAGIEVRSLGLESANTYRNPIRLCRAVRRLRGVLRSTNVRVISSAVLNADLPSRLVARSLGAEHCCHLINTTYTKVARERTRSARVTFWYARLLERRSEPLTSRYVALTETVAEYAANELRIPRTKVSVVGRGVNLNRFPFKVREPVGLSSRLRCVSVGRFVPQKNHRMCIEAVRSIKERNVVLDVVGEGPLRRDLDLAAGGTDSLVRIREPLSDVGTLLREADVYVSAALWEGQSNALLEAMASGCILLLSDIPVFHEVAGDCAIYFQPFDAADLRCRLIEIAGLDTSARRDLARRTRDRVASHYEESKMATAAVRIMMGRHVVT